jgi:transcriptional regulator with GAF, ATPase, and Fis domain
MDPTLALLVADDPRGQALRLLDHVASRCRAKAVAVVRVATDELASFAGEVPLSRLATLQTVWKTQAKDLRAGRRVMGDGYRVLPLMDGPSLTGLLLIEGAAGVELTNPAVVALAATLKAAHARPPQNHAEYQAATEAGGEIERQRLIAALDRHEWNIARVARLVGVTRRTIYLRLKRYRIDRRRVPKTLKVCPPLEGA